MENIRVNAGYRIIQSIKLDGRHEIVIGMNPMVPARYVVWDCTDGDSYDTGAYTSSYRQALYAVAERIKRRYDFLPVEWTE